MKMGNLLLNCCPRQIFQLAIELMKAKSRSLAWLIFQIDLVEILIRQRTKPFGIRLRCDLGDKNSKDRAYKPQKPTFFCRNCTLLLLTSLKNKGIGDVLLSHSFYEGEPSSRINDSGEKQ